MSERRDKRRHPPKEGSREWQRMLFAARARARGASREEAGELMAAEFGPKSGVTESTLERWEIADWWPDIQEAAAAQAEKSLRLKAALALESFVLIDPPTARYLADRLIPVLEPPALRVGPPADLENPSALVEAALARLLAGPRPDPGVVRWVAEHIHPAFQSSVPAEVVSAILVGMGKIIHDHVPEESRGAALQQLRGAEKMLAKGGEG